MPEADQNLASISKRLDLLEKKDRELHRLTQMDALASAYRYYRIRNSVIENRLKADLARHKRKIRVYYYTYILDQLSYPLVRKINEDERFSLIMLAEKPDQVEFLREQGLECYIIHSRADEFPKLGPKEDRGFQADICFSEMPYGILPSLEEAILPGMIAGGWLPKYTNIFPYAELENSLFCFVPYGYCLANEWRWLISNPALNVHYSLPYQNFSWLHFLESQSHLDLARIRNSFGNTSNYVVTGYPKCDSYLDTPRKPSSFEWKYPDGQRKRIIYAPHFQRSIQLLAKTCDTLLHLADKNEFEIIFKPHPVYNASAVEYAKKFSSHQSCQVVSNNDASQYIFATSDISIISSVSMHVDGLFSQKPYISELDDTNFNHIGKEVRAAGYQSDETTSLESMILGILSPQGDLKKHERDIVRLKLATPGISASGNIIDAITNRLGV